MNAHKFVAFGVLAALLSMWTYAMPAVVVADEGIERTGQDLPSNGNPTATELAAAILTPSTAPMLVSASKTGIAGQFEVYTASLQGFPTDGLSWALISTGQASSIAGTATTFYSYATGGPSASGWSHRGLIGYDIATLSLTLSVPLGATTLSFDWKFGTEENPTYTWSYRDTAKVVVTTPDGSSNILLLPDENLVDVGTSSLFSNAVTGSSSLPSPPYPSPNDVVYNAVTPIYTASLNVAPYAGENIRIDFQIGDERDRILDSTLFIDNLNIAFTLPVTIDFDPDTLNLKAKDKWVTVYIELPEGYDVSQIDINTVMLNDQVPAENDTRYGFVKSEESYIMDHDHDNILERMVKFDRSAVQGILETSDKVEVTVTGKLTDGTPFEGSDIIRVIDKGKR